MSTPVDLDAIEGLATVLRLSHPAPTPLSASGCLACQIDHAVMSLVAEVRQLRSEAAAHTRVAIVWRVVNAAGTVLGNFSDEDDARAWAAEFDPDGVRCHVEEWTRTTRCAGADVWEKVA